MVRSRDGGQFPLFSVSQHHQGLCMSWHLSSLWQGWSWRTNKCTARTRVSHVSQICISAPLSTATRCRRISVNPSCAGTILPLMVLHSNVHLVQSYVNKGFPAWEKIKNKHNKPQNVSSTAHFQLITDAVHLSKTHKNRYLSYNMGQNWIKFAFSVHVMGLTRGHRFVSVILSHQT